MRAPMGNEFTMVDITDEVEVELINSKHRDGAYVTLIYDGRMIVVFSPVNEQNIKVEEGYMLLRTKGSVYSFKVYKVEDEEDPY